MTVDREAYPELEVFWSDLVSVYRPELRALAAGCTYVQLDEVPCAMLCDPSIRSMVKGAASIRKSCSTHISEINQIGPTSRRT